MIFLLSILGMAEAADIPVGPLQPYTSVEDAVRDASSGDRLLLDPGTYFEDEIFLNNKSITIEAPNGPGTATIELVGGTGLFDLKNGSVLTLIQVDFDGAGIGRLAEARNGSNLILDGVTVVNATSEQVGKQGAVFKISDGSVDIVDSTIQGQIGATYNGGLAYGARTAIFTATNSVFRFGFDVSGGAFVLRNGSSLTLVDSELSANTADNGAAIDIRDGDLSVSGGVFTSNNSGEGIIRCEGGNLCSIGSSWFEGNTAANGGIVWADGPTVTRLTDSVLCGTTSGGRPVDLLNTAAVLERMVFYDNTLTDTLVSVAAGASADIINNHFVSASSPTTGAVAWITGSANFVNNLVVANSSYGGAVLLQGPGSITENHNLYFDNSDSHADFTLDSTSLVDVDPLIGPLATGDCDLSVLIPPYDSPAIDAGDPARLDLDGTVSDIGAYGGLLGNPLTDGDDDDGDGVDSPEDCNDLDPTVFPGAAELPCNGVDEDCDATTSDEPDADNDGVTVCDGDCNDLDPDFTEPRNVWKDNDFDGWGKLGGVPTPLCGLPYNGSLVEGDCDDQDPGVHPDAVEVPYDGIDQDCDGEDIVDIDGDGVSPPEDCDDHDPDRYSGAVDIPLDGEDQDCTGWDADAHLIGGAGWNCGGCSTGGAGPMAPWWLVGLGAWGVRRRR